MFCNNNLFHYYSKLVILYKTGDVYLCLLGTNGYHMKTKNERFTAQAHVIVRTSNMKILRCRLADHKQQIAPKSVLHVQYDYFSLINQSNYWFVPFTLPLLSSFLKGPHSPKMHCISCSANLNFV